MNHFEETYIYPLLTTKCNFYKRYIDDIFLLWQGTLEELKLFILQINRLHPTIKFTEEISFNSINFLDCHIINLKMENYTQVYIQRQQTENHTSIVSHTTHVHQKEVLRIAKPYVSEEYVRKKQNTSKRQISLLNN